MLYLIVLIFIVIYISCAILSAKVLKVVGESEAYWFFIFLLFGTIVVAYVLYSSKHKSNLCVNEKRKLILYQLPILVSYSIILSLALIIN